IFVPQRNHALSDASSASRYGRLRVPPVHPKDSTVGRKLLHCGIWTGLMSALGLVSRVTPVQTALRNCTRDEGRSFEVGNQVLISSHRKLLLSKAMVVNVAETSGLDSDRHG